MATPEQSRAYIYQRISEMARTVHGTVPEGAMTPAQVLDEVAETAVLLLPGVDHAGITLIRRSAPGRRPEFLESTTATGDAPRRFDQLQHEHGEGPCFESIWTQQTVHIADHTHEHRWPRLVAAVTAQTPIRSTLSIQLYTDEHELGALNLHSNTANVLGAHTEDMAINLATHAAIALSSARRGQQFRSGLASRDIIGQAKGIIMERFGLDVVQAFRLLSKLSQDSNEPVADLAYQLVAKDHPTPD
ncbi:GAF and ANTAR domain-containing protein [Rhodococcoides fascians]|uniref:GAF and ANTAR domain-containing protein n=1 Tax=Rhodococcoides fascians TaxID=1828 RepID=UPI00050C2B59|nr:GAF and ANTAR domain-containing protein [Rhodococcus fascians]